MGTHIIIPARYQSSRYPGKPLALLAGRPSIAWTIEAARQVSGTTSIAVATDDERIASVVEKEGAVVVMTSGQCRNGTERVAEATAKLALSDDDIIVNLQGDAPLTPPWFVEEIVRSLDANPDADMVTPVLRCDIGSYRNFKEDRRGGRVGATTVVFDRDLRALYFSKEVVPFVPFDEPSGPVPVFHHVGVYAYRPAALRDYLTLPIGHLEEAEQLEQLRFLEAGKRVYVTEVEARGRGFWELNNPEDVLRIEELMRSTL